MELIIENENFSIDSGGKTVKFGEEELTLSKERRRVGSEKQGSEPEARNT
jgi:hypothetical protein